MYRTGVRWSVEPQLVGIGFGTLRKKGDKGLALEEQFTVVWFKECQELDLSSTISHIWTKYFFILPYFL